MELPRLLEKLKAIAQTGLAYTKDPFDRERYEQLRELSESLAANLSNRSRDEIQNIWPIEKGYATPKVDVRAAVFRGSEVLMCRERSDGKWTLPGGWADIGESPSECVAKEVKEETGFDVQVVKLAALYDRDKHEHPKMLQHVFKAFFICDLVGGSAKPSIETSEVAFFQPSELPELSTSRVTAQQITRCFEHYQNRLLPTDFD